MAEKDDDEDLKLVKASASLLADIEAALPRILWRRPRTGHEGRRVHTCVKQRDLDFLLKKIEPFQGEPQLLDVRLKDILPPLVEAYLEHLQNSDPQYVSPHITLESAVCAVLYTFCKVRGYKVIVGFLSNEARHLETILRAVKRSLHATDGEADTWQVKYILLLWLSHLLLTPFDLASISTIDSGTRSFAELDLPESLPGVAVDCVAVGLDVLKVPTKAQDAAAAMLLRLVVRPDMQKFGLADCLLKRFLPALHPSDGDSSISLYERLGILRFLAGIAASADLANLIPTVFRTCNALCAFPESALMSNAVAKKFVVKTLRNVAILCLRIPSTPGALQTFLESTSLLEDVVDFQLRSLGDRDTPVRYAAAKAISLVVAELDPTMGHEVIQAVLDTFKDDIPRATTALDFRSVDPLKWHGLTLTLAHALFKRTASPEQLPDILNALVAALQFEQRTTTGSTLGTNVRDAANFGIWSVSRRYTTAELSAVKPEGLHFTNGQSSALQALAIQLVLSACADPAGNIRRGSSAALQELIGRHPNKVYEGIPLVQIVDYQVVGLRRRAMVEVARDSGQLHPMYWAALVEALLGWRGIGSPDVLSRQATASALAALSRLNQQVEHVLGKVVDRMGMYKTQESEVNHALILALTKILDGATSITTGPVWVVADRLSLFTGNFSPRVLQSQLPVAAAQLLTALCNHDSNAHDQGTLLNLYPCPFASLDTLVERLLSRQEESILETIPDLVRSFLRYKRKNNEPLGSLEHQVLCKNVARDSMKRTLGGAGRVVALGALTARYQSALASDEAEMVIKTLTSVVSARSVDWRVVGMQAINHTIEDISKGWEVSSQIANIVVDAIHQGMRDYTVDQRGDVGSLVRLEALSCASALFAIDDFPHDLSMLRADVIRLSLEKLERVRLQAAQCRLRFMHFTRSVTDVLSVSNSDYFYEAVAPLRSLRVEAILQTAVLEGCVSCAGIGGESLLQTSRYALARTLDEVDDETLSTHMTAFAGLLKDNVGRNANAVHSMLELLAFLFDMQIPQRLAKTDFKWRNLLSTVQKSHHKSSDVPKILAAIHVYRGLANVLAVKDEVLKKLVGMLKTNPFPRVRVAVAEALWLVTKEELIKNVDWTRSANENATVCQKLQNTYAPL